MKTKRPSRDNPRKMYMMFENRDTRVFSTDIFVNTSSKTKWVYNFSSARILRRCNVEEYSVPSQKDWLGILEWKLLPCELLPFQIL